ncbi:MAG: quinolinate synthase NadA [Eubacterium sp.]|nr:quinolinate synthase NadA [Eubacterium sp.]
MQIQEEIEKLKQEKNAVILAHYYVNEEVQAIADYVGDSFYLSKAAAKSDADVILFAGVSFMGESAKILSPDKTVLMADGQADCPMAHMVTLEEIEKVRTQYEDLAVVCYINSTAEIKTASDVCVTSANAVKIVSRLPQKNIFFIPDKNLGAYVAEQVPQKNVILCSGYCPVHNHVTKEAVKAAKAAHPGAEFLVHPECPAEVLGLADYIGSTSGIIQYATESTKREFIIGTVTGVFYELQQKNPDKAFYPIEPEMICTDMILVTLEKVRQALACGCNEVSVVERVKEGSLPPLDRMLKLAE